MRNTSEAITIIDPPMRRFRPPTYDICAAIARDAWAARIARCTGILIAVMVYLISFGGLGCTVGQGDIAGGDPTLRIFPTQLHLGLDDNGHHFSAPVAITNGAGVSCASGNGGMATVTC